MIIKIHPQNPQPRLIKQAVHILEQGGIVVYPTDTTYGMGCNIFNKKAVERLYRIKKSDKKKLFSVICSDFSQMSKYAQISNFAYKIMKHCLPGPYTFIMTGTRLLPKVTLTKRKTIGVRMPKNKIMLCLSKEYGEPILNTGISVTMEDTMTVNPIDIEQKYGQEVDLIIDGGQMPYNESSVIAFIDDQIEVIRQGLGDLKELSR
ncbi:MAG: L-threonylcarbamoyladenylate synthase [bacterium]